MPSRPMPIASIRTSLVSRPLAPARSSQRAADGTGNAEQEFHAADIRRRRRLRHSLVERRRADALHDMLALASPNAQRQADDDARYAAVAHDRIRADADDIDRQFLRQRFEEMRKIVLVRRREQHLRRTANAKPCQFRQRLVASNRPRSCIAYEIRRDIGKCHVTTQCLQFAGQRGGPIA